MPNSEAIVPWIISTVTLIFWLLALNHFSILSSLYLFMAVSMNLVTIVFILIFKKIKLIKNETPKNQNR